MIQRVYVYNTTTTKRGEKGKRINCKKIDDGEGD